MTPNEQKAILTIALLAAFADGNKAEAEREEIKRIAQTLGDESATLNLAGLYQDVLLKRINLASVAMELQDNALRQLAYEMAVCVCDADGTLTPPERAFLDTLKTELQLSGQETEGVEREAQAMAEVPLAAAQPNGSEAELDKSILNYSILNGALELLPQSWAGMAIIPLQIKMVYAIGKAHGYELDKGHITEFLATAGVGMTSQYLEQFGRKLLGGLLGQVGGGIGKSIGRTATSVAFSFATTYALGQLAKRHYAGGRQMNGAALPETFQSLLTPARQLQQQYLPQIQQRAATLDASSIMAMIKGR